jgi:uncharacterized protein DUF4129
MWHRRGLAAAIVLVALVGVLLVTWAATIGPSGVLEGDGPTLLTRPSESPSATTSASTRGAVPSEEETRRNDGSPVGDLFVNVLTVLFVAAALVLAGLLLVAAVRGLRRLRDAVRERHGEADPEATGFAVVSTPQRLARALSEDADRQRSLLAEGSPRNGIVRCWHRFEQLAEEAGLGRRAWETPGEFALRVLTTVDADEDAAYRLTLLYREARFSHHELPESAREDALEALVTIHLGLAERIGSLP